MKFINFKQIPDSPRWHFSNGRDEKGKEVSQKFAKYNRKVITEKDWENAEVTMVGKRFLLV